MANKNIAIWLSHLLVAVIAFLIGILVMRPELP